MKTVEQLEHEKFLFLADTRMQKRCLDAELLSSSALSKHLSELPDVAGQVVLSQEPQPALGSFDPETLRRVQCTFQRYTDSK